jgi:hypothetical protein
MAKKKVTPSSPQVEEDSRLDDLQEQLNELEASISSIVKDVYNKLEEIPKPQTQATHTFKAKLIDEGIDRRELFLRLLSATHQGFLANQYSDIINTEAEAAKKIELTKIFQVTMLALDHYETLLVGEVNGSE